MKLLTPPSWSGLPIYQCGYCRGDPGVRLPVSLLLHWPADGMCLEVQTESAGRSVYHAHGGRFDFLPEGAVATVLHADRVVHPLVIAVPARCVAALQPERDEDAPGVRPRLQFGDRRLERLVHRLLEQRIANEPLGVHYTQALSTILVDNLLGRDPGQNPAAPADERLRPAVRRTIEELIDERLSAPPDVTSLAALTGQGTLRFLRAFKSTLGVTLHQYVMRRRIERAKQMLAAQAPPLTALALELGFASHSHFTTAFRAHTGTTPSAYRRVSRPPRCGRGETVLQ